MKNGTWWKHDSKGWLVVMDTHCVPGEEVRVYKKGNWTGETKRLKEHVRTVIEDRVTRTYWTFEEVGAAVPPPSVQPFAFYIIWNPCSQLPPTRTFETLREAEYVAELMALKHVGQQFYVCELKRNAVVAPSGESTRWR